MRWEYSNIPGVFPGITPASHSITEPLFSPKSEVKVGADGVEKSLEGPRTSVITKPEKKLGAYWETGKFVSGYKKNSVGILFTFHSEARRRHSSYEQRSGGTWGTWCLTGT